MAEYIIGMEFSTLSAKAILVDAEQGEIRAISMCGYHDAIIDTVIPGTTQVLPEGYALQNPENYIRSMEILLGDVWRKANVRAEDIKAIGISITACTMVTLDAQMKPLCMHRHFRDNPHSWIKLWKHQGAKAESERINRIAALRGEAFIRNYGGSSTNEWMFAKIYETLNQAPEIYDAAYRFMEMGDYMVYLLTGNIVKSSCLAGYKAFWDKREGYPSKDYFSAVDLRLKNVIEEKIGNDPLRSMESCAGNLCAEWAKRTGLTQNVRVAVAGMDAHQSVPAAGIDSEGAMVMTIDSAICHMVVNREKHECPGICGAIEDGILTGYYGYEAGKMSAGDIFDWFVENLVPYTLVQRAIDENTSIYKLMDRMALEIPAGGTGLLTLNWWSGNRSIVFDRDLSGAILGMTLKTKPAEIYRALMEGFAYGARETIDTMRKSGIQIHSYYVTGIVAQRSPILLQILADVLGKEVWLTSTEHTSAMGAAIYASVASGCHPDVAQAVAHMTRPPKRCFQPDAKNHRIYNQIYAYYLKLYDYFRTDPNLLMRNIKRIKHEVDAETRRT